jgi:cold shock CspA family protein
MSRQQQQQQEAGRCVAWIGQRGFGFIEPDGADPYEDQLFVHFSALDGEDDHRRLRKGQRVTFVRGTARDGRPCATRVTPLDIDGNRR